MGSKSSVIIFIFETTNSWVKVNPARVNTFFSSESSWKPKTQPNDSRAAVWLSFWFSTRPSADTVTYLYRTHYNQLAIVMVKLSWFDVFTMGDRLWWRHQIRITSPWRSPHDDIVICINWLLYLPKAELKTKNSTKRQLCCRLVEFLVFNSIH